MSDLKTVEQDMAEIILGLQATNANLTAENLRLQHDRDALVAAVTEWLQRVNNQQPSN